MLQKIKKAMAVLIILVLLPYLITVFINGGTVRTAEGEKDERNELLKEYGLSLLFQEVSSNYDAEMLKLQAVLVRTTIYKEIEELDESIFQSEAYLNRTKPDAAWYRKLEEAWDQTDGQVVMYNDKLALVPFHQVSNGKTRVGSEVLGSEEYPYLQMKECPKDVEAVNQMKSEFINVKGAKIENSDSAGYVLNVAVGEEKVSGENFRDTYGLASSCFELQEFEGNTRVITKGVGHGLGLSQYTANEMAKEGKTYQEILQYFFEGTEIKEVAEILWDTE